MNRRTKLTAFAATTLCTLALSACGGASGSGSASSDESSTGVASADDACQAIVENDSVSDMERALDRYLEDIGSGNFDAELVQDAIGRLESATEGSPDRVAEPATKLIDDMQAYVDLFLNDGSSSDLPGTAALQADVEEMNYICPPEDS